MQVLCAVGGDEEALTWHVDRKADESKAVHASAIAANEATQGADGSAAANRPATNDASDASTAIVLSPGTPSLQQGWLPGLGPSGVVLEWSHWEANPHKLETMLNNVVHILDMMMTLSSSHVGIKALDDKVRCQAVEYKTRHVCI